MKPTRRWFQYSLRSFLVVVTALYGKRNAALSAMRSNRHWFQYSLRSFLVLLTALAVWLGIVVNRVREQREAVKAIEAMDAGVRYDWEYRDVIQPDGPAWMRRLVGDDFFQEVESVSFITTPRSDKIDIPRAIPYLQRLRVLKSIAVPDDTSQDIRDKLNAALPNCDVWNPGL